jgi:hypothetical protein
VVETHSGLNTTNVEVDNKMAVIQVQVGKNIVEDVWINGGATVNIIIKNFRTKLSLPKTRSIPYHLKMVDQSMTTPLEIIRNLKIHIHGIPYIATFTILKNSVVNFSYFILPGKPWLKDAKVTHDWGNDVIRVQGNGMVRTISVNKKLGIETRRPQVLVCYNLMEWLIDEEEDLIFETKLELFSIGTIALSEETISLLCVGMSKIRSIEEFNLE